MMLSSLHPSLAKSRGIGVEFQDTVFAIAIAVVVTLSMTWVGLLIINSLIVLPAASARNICKNMRSYHLCSVISALVCGISGLLISYYIGASSGAAISICLGIWFVVTFLIGQKRK